MSQNQWPSKFKDKYLVVLVYLLMNHDAFFTVIALDYGTVFVLFMYEYVDAFLCRYDIDGHAEYIYIYI